MDVYEDFDERRSKITVKFVYLRFKLLFTRSVLATILLISRGIIANSQFVYAVIINFTLA